jgi:glycosyltransferase involved in cell wall biosynthesis
MSSKESEGCVISVIVPVYNVGLYLRQCMDSILCQTYRKLEIILVNDGSEDDSGEICDEYAQSDNRITVIHKGNEGVGAARNVGLDCAAGKYTMFVDSDDWLTPDAVQILHDSIIDHEADVACGSYFIAYVDSGMANIKRGVNMVFNKHEAIKEILLNRKIRTFFPGKLFVSELFKGIRFPNDMIYCEDSVTILHVFSAANKIVGNDRNVYCYRQRRNSVVHGEYTKRIYNDAVKATAHNMDHVNKHFPDLILFAELSALSMYISLLKRMVYLTDFTKLDEYGIAIKQVRNHFLKILTSPYLCFSDKVSATCISINIYLFGFVLKRYRRGRLY